MYPAPGPELAPVEVYPLLWQGPRPPKGRALREAGVHVVVLCEPQFQPPEREMPGVLVLRCPFDDVDYLPDMGAVRQVVTRVADFVLSEGCAVIACHMGVNRSGLVAALTRRYITGESGEEVLKAIDAIKPYSLTNKTFRAFVSGLGRRQGAIQKSRAMKLEW